MQQGSQLQTWESPPRGASTLHLNTKGKFINLIGGKKEKGEDQNQVYKKLILAAFRVSKKRLKAGRPTEVLPQRFTVEHQGLLR